MKFHSLGKRFLDFLVGGGHLRLRAAVEDGYFLCPEAKRSSRRIHRRIAAADNGHAIPQRYLITTPDLSQKVDGLHHLRAVLSLNAHPDTPVRPDGDEDSVIAFFQQPVYRVNAAICLYLHAGIFYLFYLRPDGVFGQPIFRYAPPHHPAGLGQGLVYRH